MSRQVPGSRFASWSKLACAIGLASLSAACSSGASRFAENPFANPFGPGPAPTTQPDPMMTGAVPRGTVQAGQLPPPSYPGSAPVASAPLPTPAAAPQPAYAMAQPVRPAAGAPAGWTAQGGTPVTLQPGESVVTLANRYGVPASAILSANGLTNASQAKPGQQVIIPVYNAVAATRGSAASAPVATAPARAMPAPARPIAAAVKPVAPQPSAKPAAKVAAAPAVKPAPVAKSVATKPVVAAAPVAAKPVAARAEPVKAAEPVRAVEKETAAETTASIAPQSAADFRWPARGRVIAGFDGKRNEGINIAVPEGTPVKAAEGGTVAYAGSELKGYGNLVLIRHDNGYVSAYAHNGDISVKRGERVKRGQTIATSGQTGNVSSPQLHFELRKGSTPVDPMKYLASN